MALQPYSIRADSQTMEALGRIAEAMDRSRNWVINDALKAYVEDNAWLEEQVAVSRREIADGKGIAHDEAMARMRRHIEGHSPDARNRNHMVADSP